MENKVTKDMLIGEIVSKYPESIEILMGAGMHCLGCPSSQMESLSDACAVHGISSDALLAAIKIRRKLLSVNSSFLFFAWPKACHYLNCLIAPSTSVAISSE